MASRFARSNLVAAMAKRLSGSPQGPVFQFDCHLIGYAQILPIQNRDFCEREFRNEEAHYEKHWERTVRYLPKSEPFVLEDLRMTVAAFCRLLAP